MSKRNDAFRFTYALMRARAPHTTRTQHTHTYTYIHLLDLQMIHIRENMKK